MGARRRVGGSRAGAVSGYERERWNDRRANPRDVFGVIAGALSVLVSLYGAFSSSSSYATGILGTVLDGVLGNAFVCILYYHGFYLG